MDTKIAYEIIFVFQVKLEKDDMPVTKTYIKNIIAEDINTAINWGKNYIPKLFNNLYFQIDYVGHTILNRRKIYILN